MARKKTAKPAAESARRHIEQLIQWMSQGVYEKEQLIAVALLCAVAGENIFLLGPPGTAKSMVAARLKAVFKDGRSFDYLMSRFSTPDEIFGPVSVARLKNDDRYERLTAGYLPEAHVVFLDEIWKAGPSIQNTLLTVINEHIFHNGGTTVRTPMKVLIAASNELPAKDEGLEALWDRFLMRMVSNCIANERNFLRMMKEEIDQPAPLADELYITDELYEKWQAGAKTVAMAKPVEEAVKALRRILAAKEKEDGNGLRFYVSDRRWRKAFRIMQTSAYLNGRNEINLSDFLLLIHSFWNDVEGIPTVIEAFAAAISDGVARRLDSIEKSLRRLVAASDGKPDEPRLSQASASAFAEYDYFYYRIEGFADGDAYFAKWDYSSLSSTPAEGVKYFDSRRGKYIVHILTPGRPFDAKTLNATDIKKVRLEKWVNGAIIDGTPYRFERIGAEHADDADAPFYFRAKKLLESFDVCVDEWEQSVQSNFDAADNLFLAAPDIAVIEKARKDISSRIKTLQVKINNVASLLK